MKIFLILSGLKIQSIGPSAIEVFKRGSASSNIFSYFFCVNNPPKLVICLKTPYDPAIASIKFYLLILLSFSPKNLSTNSSSNISSKIS